MDQQKLTLVKCPQCGVPVVWSDISPFRPFCNKRCQLIDLGEWEKGEKSISNVLDISDD
ncbi:DNA gyrase inhibitor YacG [Candidatus Enterovibrio escicola]|uniref:DNA gyrase inhibitor YacG n=1 Tax=Candidatus Enterovibrio escicola TaxID=1927127 RepID=A0A2A5T5E1_9GAMM|nr:DNA gyrase inhibitor YacG [Candidatus Enterovibrio escacola]PCS23385.1 zinc-binding protein [Candidatus Enterovibrio escacola]